MTQINWQYQVNNRAGGYIVTNTDWNDFAGNFRSMIDQTTGSGTTDNVALPIGIDLVNHKVFISDPTSTVACTPEAANNTASAQLQVSANSQDATFALTAAHDTEATSSVIQLRKADGSQASPALVDDDAVLGKIMFQGYDGNSWANGAQIRAQIDGTPADGDMPTEMIFMVTPDGGSETPATAVTISPDKKVTFAGATQHDSTLTVGVDDSGYDVIFYGATTTNGYAWWDQSTDAFIVGPAGHLSFGETAPTWPVEFATDDDLTSFTGTAKGAVCITNSQYDSGDWTALDFGYTGSDNPIGRIAVQITGGGSRMAFGTSDNYSNGIETQALYINEDGLVGIGTTLGTDMPETDGTLSIASARGAVLSSYRKNTVSSNINTWFLSDYSATGTIHCKIYNDGDIQNTNNSYGALSDERLKVVSEARDYYEDLRKLEVINYQLTKKTEQVVTTNSDGEESITYQIVDRDEPTTKCLGLVAQQAENHIPGLVKEGHDGMKELKYSVLVPMLLQAFQKLADKVEALETS
jgi:hypothetical protein